MAEFVPFRGFRYDSSIAGPLSGLICPPYDVIDERERDRLYARSPYNFVRIEFPRDGQDDRYARAATDLGDWVRREVLRRDGRESFYIHEHEFEIAGRRLVRRGIFGALRLHPQSEGVVLPHELTFPKAKADRLELLRATHANTSPVFGMFADEDGLMGSLGHAARATADETTLGAERHRLERIDDAAAVARITSALRDRRVYIADGHHRYETALNHLADLGDVGPNAPERYTLAFLCALEDPGLRILATHRIVLGAEEALETAIARSFDASEIDRGALGDIQPGIVVSRGGVFRSLTPRSSTDLSALPAAWRTLPVAVAEELLVKPAREAGAEIAYEHDTERAIAAGTAILLRAVDPPTLRRVADAGEKLPQKTTYFYPKVP
ncbi:MAG TPA: DUF1015 domain-containing protein, partial [Candidatus Limnocylindria bacterium]|nr:DUF1015 domain-containing protein [Candidatus Limnocylindria bacterium]